MLLYAAAAAIYFTTVAYFPKRPVVYILDVMFRQYLMTSAREWERMRAVS